MTEVVVAGEALIDLVASTDGQVRAHLGGGPYNAARTMARLGVPTTFFGRLAGDGFGRLLRERLTEEGVGIAVAEPSGRPSTLAVVAVDDAGVASYSFYLDGTSVADLDYAAARRALPAGMTALHVGSLGLLMEPVGTSVERLLLTEVPPGTARPARPQLPPGCRRRPRRLPRAHRRLRPPRRHRQGEHGGPGLPVPGPAASGSGRAAARGRPVARPGHRRAAPGPGVPARRRACGTGPRRSGGGHDRRG